LNAVIGYAEMLTEEFEARRDSEAEIADIADRVIPDLGRIRSAGRHLLSIINDVLDLSKIEAGKMVARPENFELEELVHGVIDTVEPLAEKNDNELRLELEDDLGQMHSDATKVRQILVNLLSNAFKFTEEGTVTLTVRSDEADEEIVLEVEDTGIGMSQEELEGIFEAFTQVDGSSTRRFGGTGLGLTITRHLCTMLEGEIDMTSAPDEGTRVTARLPRHIEGPSAESDAEKTSETATVV
ncbi:MAG: sensor histidine kinase, partial [Persicimonas sp.]